MAESSPEVLHERRGHTLVVTIDRPRVRNALTWDAIHEIGELCTTAGHDDEVRAVVITGAGDQAFSSGGDIDDQQRRADWPIGRHAAGSGRLLSGMRGVFDCPKPVVAAVNGVAAGGGAGLALLADIRIASRNARIGFPYPRLGLGPDFGVSWTLPRAVGPGQASRLLFTGAYVDAEEALRIGLVDLVAEEGGALDAALALCDEISAVAPLSTRWAKTGLRRAEELSFAQAIEAEIQIQHIGRNTEDHREGIKAFREKRSPDFKGR